MKKIKNQFFSDKSDICMWLYQMGVVDYTLIKDPMYGFVVDVGGGVDISNRGLRFIQVKFNTVEGSFTCSNNQLQTLLGSPMNVGVGFYCNNNNLTSLKGCPVNIERSFTCSHNEIESLIGAPKEIKGDFGCSHNLLISLEGAPLTVGGAFACTNNLIADFKFCPKHVGGDFFCSENKDLGDAQNIHNFKNIFKRHLHILEIERIKQEKLLLNTHVGMSTNTLPQHFKL